MHPMVFHCTLWRLMTFSRFHFLFHRKNLKFEKNYLKFESSKLNYSNLKEVKKLDNKIYFESSKSLCYSRITWNVNIIAIPHHHYQTSTGTQTRMPVSAEEIKAKLSKELEATHVVSKTYFYFFSTYKSRIQHSQFINWSVESDGLLL